MAVDRAVAVGGLSSMLGAGLPTSGDVGSWLADDGDCGEHLVQRVIPRSQVRSVLENLLIESLDLRPRSRFEILTRHRPCLDVACRDWNRRPLSVEIGCGWFDGYDPNCLMFFRGKAVGDVVAVRLQATCVTEEILVDGAPAYRSRMQMFDSDIPASMELFRMMYISSFFGVLGYTDDRLVGGPAYHPNNPVHVARLVADPSRLRPVLVMIRPSRLAQRRDREFLVCMSEIFAPWGHVASLREADLALLGGLEIERGSPSNILCIDPPGPDDARVRARWVEIVSVSAEFDPRETRMSGVDCAFLPESPVLGSDGCLTLPGGERRFGHAPGIFRQMDVRTGLLHFFPGEARMAQLIAERLPRRDLRRPVAASDPAPEAVHQGSTGGPDVSASAMPELSGLEAADDAGAVDDAGAADDAGVAVVPESAMSGICSDSSFADPVAEETGEETVSGPSGMAAFEAPSARLLVRRGGLARYVGSVVFPGVHVHGRALRELRRTGHPEPERILAALDLLSRYRLASFRGDRQAFGQFVEGLREWRLWDGFTNAEYLRGLRGSDYEIMLDGQKLLLDRKIASNASGFNDPKMIRIYYCYDRVGDRIVVGWLPTHLRTLSS